MESILTILLGGVLLAVALCWVEASLSGSTHPWGIVPTADWS